MNFSNNRKLSKLLSLILVCAMLCTLFAGCKKEEAAPSTEPNDNSLNLNLNETLPPPETEPAPTEPEETEPKENMGTITQQQNIRSMPSMQGRILETLDAGDRVEIMRQETVVGHSWGYIEEPVVGWIVMDYVEMDNPVTGAVLDGTDTPAETGPAPSDPTGTAVTLKGTINVNGLNIRSEASTDGKIQGSYNKGDVITILETKNGWGRTDKGWVLMEHVTTGNTGSTGNTNNNKDNNDDVQGNGSTSVILKGVVNVKELNLRSKASTDGERLGSLKYGDRVEVLEKSGSWGRTEKGWVHLGYVYQDGTTGDKTDNGTVTGDNLNIRSGPGTGYGTVGSYTAGDRVKILEQFTYGNTTWGCTSKGWISLDYVELDSYSDEDQDDEDKDDDTVTDVERTGTVTSNLNIRDGAGTNYEIVGSFSEGDRVTITQIKGDWGKTKYGWININYVDFDDDANDDVEDTDEEQTGTVTRNLNVRSGPGTDYEVVSGLAAGDHVTIYRIEDGWGEIDAGWISMKYVTLD